MLKFVSKVCPILIRWHYTEARLEPLIKLDISSSGGGVQYYYQSQEGTCYLTVANLSPFDFTIDRMEVVIATEGGELTFSGIFPQVIKATATQSIFIRDRSPVLLETAQRAKASKRARLDITAYVTSSIRCFTIRRHLSNVTNVEVWA